MRIAKIILFLLKKFSLRRNLEILSVILILVVLSFSELFGLLVVKETISSITSDTNSNYAFFNILNKIFPNQYSNLERNAILLIFITLNTLFLRTFSIWYSLRIVAKADNDIATLIYQNVIYQPYKFHLERNSSEVVSLLTVDSLRVGDTVRNILQIATSIFISLGVVIGLLLVNWKLSILSFLLVFSFYALFNFKVKKTLKIAGKFITDAWDIQIRLISESIGNIRNVLLDNNQIFYSKIFKKLNRKLRDKSSKVIFLTVIPRYLIESIGIVALSIYLFILSRQGVTLENTISYIGVIAYGSQKLIPSINNIYSSYSDIYYAQASLEKVLKTLYFPDKEEIEKDVNLKAKKELEFEKIEFKNLYFNFGKNQKNILDNIDLTICRGEKIGIIGSTGSGKSTFIDIIMGLLKPSEGEIIINGKNLYGNSEEEFIYEWRSIISHVPQSIFITDNSIEENIALGTNRNSIDQRLLVESSKIAEIYDFIVNTKHKFRTQVGERGSRLSGGQKQRIGIARAIYKKPKILIFDEATSALDSHTENKIINNISKLSTNTTLIMIAHRTSTLRFCDQIYQIKNNKLISRGTPEKTFDL